MTTMQTLQFSGPGQFAVIEVPIPDVGDNDILIKVAACGVCGSDAHIAAGDFLPTYPLTPGHELVGAIAKIGKNVEGFSIGDRCVVDPVIPCHKCFFCRRAKFNMCSDLRAVGVTADVYGGFGEYTVVPSQQVNKIFNLTNEEAVLIEPTSCAIHSVDMLSLPPGSEVLVLGAGPSGLMLVSVLKQTGALKVVLAANKSIKTQIAQTLHIADAYIELDRSDPAPQWEKLKTDYPFGFDAVVEATGSSQIANDALQFVRKGGALCLYSFYAQAESFVKWSPLQIFTNEIRIMGTFAQSHCFPRAVAYLESGKIDVKGLVTHKYPLSEFQQVLDRLKSKDAMKIMIEL